MFFVNESMKVMVKWLNVCLVLALAAALMGCGGVAEEQPPAANAAAGSEYPPLSAAIADAPFEMLDGTQSKISDRKGKVVLVNLWATWCGFCKVEMPHLVAMQNQYRDKGFTVLGLDVGEQNTGKPETIEEITTFAHAMGLNYELARADGALTGRLQKLARSQAVPLSFVIDREGRLRGRFIGGGAATIKQMEDVVAKVVNE